MSLLVQGVCRGTMTKMGGVCVCVWGGGGDFYIHDKIVMD